MDGEAVGVMPLTAADFAHLSAEAMAYEIATEEQDGPPPLTDEFKHGCYYIAVMFVVLASVTFVLRLADGAGWLN
jgi:hypothetical protein